jgi:hypothetical protein
MLDLDTAVVSRKDDVTAGRRVSFNERPLTSVRVLRVGNRICEVRRYRREAAVYTPWSCNTKPVMSPRCKLLTQSLPDNTPI